MRTGHWGLEGRKQRRTPRHSFVTAERFVREDSPLGINEWFSAGIL